MGASTSNIKLPLLLPAPPQPPPGRFSTDALPWGLPIPNPPGKGPSRPTYSLSAVPLFVSLLRCHLNHRLSRSLQSSSLSHQVTGDGLCRGAQGTLFRSCGAYILLSNSAAACIFLPDMDAVALQALCRCTMRRAA